MEAQKKGLRKPSFSLTVRQYGHPEKSGGTAGSGVDGLQWGLFQWRNAYSDATTKYYHGMCFDGDGNMHRVRAIGAGTLYYQKVAAPTLTSTFTTWTDTGSTAGCPIAIAALGDEVIIAWIDTATPTKLTYILSADNGTTWDAEVEVDLTGVATWQSCQSIAMCYKSDGRIMVLAAVTQNDATRHLISMKRTAAGVWSAGTTFASDIAIDGICMYYDLDWNAVAQVLVSGSYVMQRIIYGDDGKVTINTYSTPATLDLAAASVETEELFKQYSEFTRSLSMDDLRQFVSTGYTQTGRISPAVMDYYQNLIKVMGYGNIYNAAWAAQAALILVGAESNLDFYDPFICKPSGQPPILSIFKNGQQWFYRLKSGSDFIDDDWSKAYYLPLADYDYGMALATDGTYIWGSRADSLYRSYLPNNAWITPTIGTGAHASSETIAQAAIASIDENIENQIESSLDLIIDNSDSAYDSLPTTHIKKGSRVEFNFGIDGLYPTERNHYFIEDFGDIHKSPHTQIRIHCIDALGLLERYKLPGGQEYNLSANEKTVYEIIEKAIQCIGGTLTYISRSTDMATFYPQVIFTAGESGASVLRRLLSLVPDVIRFRGLEGCIINPLTTDTENYVYNNS